MLIIAARTLVTISISRYLTGQSIVDGMVIDMFHWKKNTMRFQCHFLFSSLFNIQKNVQNSIYMYNRPVVQREVTGCDIG